jgi:O-antigen ligase
MRKLNSFNFDIATLLLCLLPFSVIFGNLILNVNIFFIISLYLVDTFKSHNLKLFLRDNKIILFLLFFFLFFNLIVSINWQLTLRGQLGLLKHIFLYFTLIHFFFKKDSNFELLVKMFFFAILFVLVDSYIQFFFDKDLLGHKVTENHGRRLSGPFGDEYIVGSFILKTIFITKYNKYFENNYNWLVYLLISFILVILASQRMPSLMLSASLIIIFLIEDKINLRAKISIFLVSLLCLFLIFNYNSKIKKHYIDRTFDQIGMYNSDNKTPNFWDSQWGAHYLTAIEIYKDNLVFGSGLKTYRFECGKKKYKKINSLMVENRCSTHPHNIYFEIISETGTIGILFFFYFLINFIKSNKLFSKKNIKNNPEIIILLFIFFWPLQSTGSLFSTWNGFFYPLIMSYIYYISKKKINDENF